VSTIRNPVGPEEPSTYWRRRAAVVVGLLVALWLAWWLVQTAFGSGDEPAVAEPSASPSFGLSLSPSADPTASPAPTASAQPEPSASDAASASPSATAAQCADSDLSVVVAPASTSLAVGEGTSLTMTVTNDGNAACSRDVGPGANEIRVTSGSVLVWSSDFCNPSDTKRQEVLQPGGEFTTSVTWPGTITQKSCPSDQPLAQPGTYRTIARNGSIESEPVTFTIQ
jgi:hypothetical protein